MKEYEYPTGSFRARCLKVVDGDTADLVVDVGFHSFREERFRFSLIDTPELRDRDVTKRAAAKVAKAFVVKALLPGGGEEWPLRIETERDPDSFGRYLCLIYFMGENSEVCLNHLLVEEGHAVYRTY
jgi:micrococcal nuclease